MKLDTEKYHRNREISPWRILYILLAVNVFLAIFMAFFPEGERWIGDKFKLQFVSAQDVFNPTEIIRVDLDSVLGDMALDDTSNFDQDIFAEADSAVKMPELNKRIQYPSVNPNALTNFFEALLRLEKGENQLYRILHYGDSQLEGDRISDYLRNKLQLRFDGGGPGMVLPIDVSHSRISVLQSESRDWQKYAIYGKTRHPQGVYGIGGASFVYTGTLPVKVGVDTTIKVIYDSLIPKKIAKKTNPKDSGNTKIQVLDTPSVKVVMVPWDSTKFKLDTVIRNRYEMRVTESSWLRFKCATQSYPKVRTFNNVELMYTTTDTCMLTLSIDGVQSKRKLLPTKGAHKILLFTGVVSQEVMIRFSGASPIVFGVMLDGLKGIAVDNFPMRGSSGTGYEIINQKLYSDQLHLTNTKLIVMQYGINVVPNPTSNYKFYEHLFYNQLKAIKQAAPDVNILVIGPSDMSRKVGDTYVSYPNITKIRDAMRNAAFRTDCAFWDLYAAMGGENSMVSWVENSPTLASKDFTHFNTRGARFVGEMLYDALMSEYISWKQQLVGQTP